MGEGPMIGEAVVFVGDVCGDVNKAAFAGHPQWCWLLLSAR